MKSGPLSEGRDSVTEVRCGTNQTSPPKVDLPGEVILRKLYEIFTPQERMQALLIFFAGLHGPCPDGGVFSIFPFINVVMDPASIQQNKWLADVYDRILCKTRPTS